MYTPLPVCEVNSNSVCTALYAGRTRIDVGSRCGDYTIMFQKFVNTLFIVDDTVQFVFSVGNPTKRLYPGWGADD